MLRDDSPPRRPLLAGDLEVTCRSFLPDVLPPEQRQELAQTTAEAVLSSARDGSSEVDLVSLADIVGLDTLAHLWSEAPADSLPGALWTLYLLRAWLRRSPEEVARLYQVGRAVAPVEEVVAGVEENAGHTEIVAFADTLFLSMCFGDVAVAWERAAAFFRVVAAGRDRSVMGDDVGGSTAAEERVRAARHRICADALSRAARSWRV